MKKKILIIFLVFIMTNSFAREKMGICKGNVYSLDFTDNNTPVCLYYEEEEGLISLIKKLYVQYGNNYFGPYDSVYSMIVSNDRIIYVAGTDQNYYVYVNGIESSKAYNQISYLNLLDDNKTLIYCYEIEGKEYLHNGNEDLGPFEEVKDFYISNTKLLGYTIKENNDYFLFINDSKYGPFDEVGDVKIGNNNSFAIVTKKDKKEYIYNSQGLLAGPFGVIILHSISGKGNKISYVTLVDENDLFQSTLWVDNTIIDQGYYFSNVHFLYNDDLLYTYCDDRLKEYIHFGQKEYGPYSLIFGNVVLSDDKKLLAFSYPEEACKHYLHVGNEIAGPFESCDKIYISPDNKKVLYIIREGNSKYLVYKQKKIGPYNYIYDVFFDNSNSDFAYITEEKLAGPQRIHMNEYRTSEYDYIFEKQVANGIVSFKGHRNLCSYDMVFFNGKEYVGRYKNGTLIYIDDGIIYKE